MNGNEIDKRLRALACDDKRRSKIARLREVFDGVEAALAAGVSQANVLSELSQAGLSMPMATFKSALQRIRKQRSSNNKAPTTAVAKATGMGGESAVVESSVKTEEMSPQQKREAMATTFIGEQCNSILKNIHKEKIQ